MTIRKRRGYLIIDFKGDHRPYHVHICKGEEFIGRYDIENQRQMDKFKMTKTLRKALIEEGLMAGSV